MGIDSLGASSRIRYGHTQERIPPEKAAAEPAPPPRVDSFERDSEKPPLVVGLFEQPTAVLTAQNSSAISDTAPPSSAHLPVADVPDFDRRLEANQRLEKKMANQFLPEEVLSSGNPADVRRFISESNSQAYAGREGLALQCEEQTQRAIATFDRCYENALANTADPRAATAEAGAEYNRWIFYNGEPCDALAKAETTLFASGMKAQELDITDVKQQSLGNCYFTATLAALAHTRPELIQEMVRDNKDGTYLVTLYREGADGNPEKFESRVDLTTAFNWSRTKISGDEDAAGALEVWPQVIEKAYAVEKGSYGLMEGGFPDDAFFTLTGSYAPRKPAYGVSGAEIEKNLLENKPMMVDTWPANTPDSAFFNKKLFEECYLTPLHAYTVHSVETGPDGNKYLRLYNPVDPGGSYGTVPEEAQLLRVPLKDANKLLRLMYCE